jgi:hypothetical protein
VVGATATVLARGELLMLLIAVPNIMMGAIVLLRADYHPVGWLLLVVGFGQVLTSSDVSASTPATLLLVQGAGLATWIAYVLLLLLFPTGRLPATPGGRRWSRVALSVCAAAWLIGMFSPTLDADGVQVDNPIGVPLGVEGLDGIGWLLVWATLFGSIAGVVLRWRRASGIERQQYRWVGAPLVVLAVYMGGVAVAGLMIGPREASTVLPDAIWIVPVLAYIAVPVCIGVAIMRLRLWEIDRIVSRTVTYLVVAAVVGSAYALTVLALSGLVGGDSDVAVAASTLLAATVFNPVRRRVQGVVDRRFNRARYDATIEAQRFAARIRDIVDGDELAVALGDVVATTLTPAGARLWLRRHA